MCVAVDPARVRGESLLSEEAEPRGRWDISPLDIDPMLTRCRGVVDEERTSAHSSFCSCRMLDAVCAAAGVSPRPRMGNHGDVTRVIAEPVHVLGEKGWELSLMRG